MADFERAVEILKAIPRSRRLTGGYFRPYNNTVEYGMVCPVMAMALAINPGDMAPMIRDWYIDDIGPGAFHEKYNTSHEPAGVAETIVTEELHLNTDRIITIVDNPQKYAPGTEESGWDTIINALEAHDVYFSL